MLPATDRLIDLLKTNLIKPQLVLEVEGLPVFSSTPLQVYNYYGQEGLEYGDEGLVYGGLSVEKKALPYIDLSKSTNSIQQQLLIDKGGYSSSTNFKIHMIDKNEELTQLITPKKVVDEVLGKKASLYMTLEGGGHPEDSILFFAGIVSDIESGAGYVALNITSPEKLKNSKLFPQVTTETTATITDSDTTIPVVFTSEFIAPADSGTLKSYIKIDDEIIEWTGKTDTSFTGCVRGQFGTIPAAHDIEASCESFYRLQGNLRDLSLKLMLSGGDEFYVKDLEIESINEYGTLSVPNAVFLNDYNLETKYGIVTGDILEITDSVSNDGTYNILSVVTADMGSYIIVDGTLSNEGTGPKISIKSKYNTLPALAGLGMTPDQVDVQEFESIYTQYNSKFFNYDFYIKEEKDGAEFINSQILYPSGCYALPRKAKTSIGIMTPPLAKFGTKRLSNINVVDAHQIKINRSISKNFYNAVVYKYDPDAVEDKFLKGRIYLSNDSTNRIKIGNRPLSIEAEGVRQDGDFEGIFEAQSEKFLRRYQYGAEFFDIKTTFGEGFTIEIGDTVIVDGSKLNMSDTKDQNGTRVFFPRLFEVQNKTMSLKGDPITLTLVDTAFSLDGRFGVVGPSSRILEVVNSSTIRLKKSQNETIKNLEPREKWQNYIGERVLVRTKDWTWSQEVTLSSFQSVNLMILSEPLAGYPSDEILVVEMPKYSGDKNTKALYKATHVFRNKTIVFDSVSSPTVLNLDPADIPFVKVNDVVVIHNKDYSELSPKNKIVSIIGNDVTLQTPLTFTPQPEARIQLLSHVDSGTPYIWL